jgi:hypothetical protein
MNDHINEFNWLLQSVNYNRPPEIPAFQPAAINLSFLQSLGPDWEVWGMANGETIQKTPTAELMAEVRALAMRGKASTQTADSATSSTDLNAKAANLNDSNHRDDNRGNPSGKWKKKRDNKGRSRPYVNGRNGKNNRRNNSSNNGRRSSLDPNKYCTVYQCQGHNIFECHKAKREKHAVDGKNDEDNGRQGNGRNDRSHQDRSQQSYQPSYSYPSYPHSSNTVNHIANVTHFIEANSTAEIATGPDDWLVDPGANAYSTMTDSCDSKPFYSLNTIFHIFVT